MIRYRLKCEKRHEFEGWFASSTRLRPAGQARPGDLSAVRYAQGRKGPDDARHRQGRQAQARQQKPPAAPAQPEVHRLAAHGELAAAMRKLRAEVEAKSEYVGERFSEEARKIHYEETPARGIYGEATRDEARALSEEGIEFFPLPILPEDQN